MRKLLLMPATIIVVGVALGSADEPRAQRDAKDKEEKQLTDKQFFLRAAERAHSEVERAELAKERGDSEPVRQLAEALRRAHNQWRDGLASAGVDLKTAVVSGLSKEHKECMARLRKLKGGEFDREYLKSVIENHNKVIKLYQAEARNGKIDALRKFAKKHVPALENLRTEAQKVRKKIQS